MRRRATEHRHSCWTWPLGWPHTHAHTPRDCCLSLSVCEQTWVCTRVLFVLNPSYEWVTSGRRAKKAPFCFRVQARVRFSVGVSVMLCCDEHQATVSGLVLTIHWVSVPVSAATCHFYFIHHHYRNVSLIVFTSWNQLTSHFDYKLRSLETSLLWALQQLLRFEKDPHNPSAQTLMSFWKIRFNVNLTEFHEKASAEHKHSSLDGWTGTWPHVLVTAILS